MKRIGILSKPIEQGTSGSGSHLENLLNHIYLLNKNFEITLIHYKSSKKKIFKKFEQLIIPRNPILSSRLIAKKNFDLLHYSPLTIFSPIYVGKVKKVATIHGGASFFLPEQYGLAYRFHENNIRPILCKQMDRIFTVSEKSKDLIINSDGYEKDRIIVTYNAVDDSYYKNELNYDSKNVFVKYHIKKPYIFHVSKYSKRKNPDTILRTIKHLKAQRNDIKLVIAGNGWNNTKVKEFIEKNDLKNSVDILGFLDKAEIISLYHGAVAFIFPSLFEGFGMPNLEAMACGVPVITSDAFAIPEIVGEGAYVLKNKFDEKEIVKVILKLINNTEFKKQLINKGFETVKKYSWNNSAKMVLDTYTELTSNDS